MLPSALQQREQDLSFFEFPESGTLPLAMNFIPEENESPNQENLSGELRQSVTQSTNPNSSNMLTTATSFATQNLGYSSQPEGQVYHTEKYSCCFCDTSFTKLQQHMPRYHPYVFSDLMAADRPMGPDTNVRLPFMSRGARALMVPYIVAMRYSHERYSEATPDWVREAIANIIERSDAPEKIDLMSQLPASEEESDSPAEKKQKGKRKKKSEGGQPSDMELVALSKKAKDDALLAFGESIPVVNGSTKKKSSKASTSKKRKSDESSEESDHSDAEKPKKKRSRAAPPAPVERAVIEHVEDESEDPSASSAAARMLTGHISSIAMGMKHAKGDGVKLASYIAANVGFDILKAAVVMLNDFCHEGKFEVRSNGDVHYVWKGMFKKKAQE